MQSKKRIGLRDVRALAAGSIVYDADVLGFAAQRQRDSVSYVLRYRTSDGRQRWYTIGRHGAPWTPELAREEARRLLGEVARGKDPAGDKRARREAASVDDLCNDYLNAVEAGHYLTRTGKPKKLSTVATDRSRIDAHIRPLLGRKLVTSLTSQDVRAFMHSVADGKTAQRIKTGNPRGLSNVRGGRGTAARTVTLLGSIMTYAIEKGIRTDNPVRGVRKFAENRRERRLSDCEYAAIGAALQKAAEPPERKPHSRRDVEPKGMWAPALATIWFLLLTGWRSGEALNLRWAEVDLSRRTAFLNDTKTGKSMRPLSHAACDLLSTLPRVGTGEYVFPASRGTGVMSGFGSYWKRIAKLADLPADVVPHTMRHSFASLAADLGYSELTIGALIGHKGHSITSRYVHAADAVLLAAADVIARRTAELMGDTPQDAVVVHLQKAR
jgi:integrase